MSQTVEEYPAEHQQEEQWVRNTVKVWGFKEEFLRYWELAVEQAKENRRPLYYKLKKDHRPTLREMAEDF